MPCLTSGAAHMEQSEVDVPIVSKHLSYNASVQLQYESDDDEDDVEVEND